MERLNESSIRSHLQDLNHLITFHLFDTIHSTNQFLKDQPQISGIQICCAEEQTQGRGRFGRTWHSPQGENIYCSIRLKLDNELSKLSGLSLVVSLAVIETLHEFINTSNPAERLMIKWPNDILWHRKKMSGCLIELVTAPQMNTEVVIGIGININSNTQLSTLLNTPWCSLFEITNQLYDRNIIIGRLIHHVYYHLRQFITHGLVYFAQRWKNVDQLDGQFISVSTPAGKISGYAKGIDEIGQLILMDNNNIQHHLSSGETTLHT